MEGRPGAPPAWPLLGHSVREADLWRMLWRRPQAVQWERMGQDLEVALYTRNFTLAELPGAPVNLGTLLRQQADALGLTIPGLRVNRWKIATDQVAEQRAAAEAKTPAKAAAAGRRSARDRFQVVGGNAATG